MEYTFEDELYEPFESISKQIAKMAAEAAAKGQIVRIECMGETVGFMCPEGWFPGEAKFTYAGIPFHVVK